MSRSRHHGCGKACGLCKPHKLQGNAARAQKPAVQRRVYDATEAVPPSESEDWALSFAMELGE